MYVLQLKDSGPKVRVLNLGSRQVAGFDYEAPFALVGKFSSNWLVLAPVALLDLGLEQIEVVTAFLHGDIENDIYICLLPLG